MGDFMEVLAQSLKAHSFTTTAVVKAVRQWKPLGFRVATKNCAASG